MSTCKFLIKLLSFLSIFLKRIPSVFRSCGRKIAEAKLFGFGLECKVWDNSASIFISLESFQITNPCNGNLLLVLGDVRKDQTCFKLVLIAC
jgi:hypothetical protein